MTSKDENMSNVKLKEPFFSFTIKTKDYVKLILLKRCFYVIGFTISVVSLLVFYTFFLKDLINYDNRHLILNISYVVDFVAFGFAVIGLIKGYCSFYGDAVAYKTESTKIGFVTSVKKGRFMNGE